MIKLSKRLKITRIGFVHIVQVNASVLDALDKTN